MHRAHAYEKIGLAHWATRLQEEIEGLEAIKVEVFAFKEQVKELVCTFIPSQPHKPS